MGERNHKKRSTPDNVFGTNDEPYHLVKAGDNPYILGLGRWRIPQEPRSWWEVFGSRKARKFTKEARKGAACIACVVVQAHSISFSTRCTCWWIITVGPSSAA